MRRPDLQARYLSREDQWEAVVRAVRKAGLCGLDTETYGHDITETGAPHRAKIHVWSLGIRTSVLHPRGYHVASSVVLPAAALGFRPLVDLLEDPGVTKVLHNKPHDRHGLANHGVGLAGGIDTLPLARVVLAQDPTFTSFDLKTLGRRLLGRTPRSFEDVTGERATEWRARKSEHWACTCGVEGCRKRKGHRRLRWRVFHPELRDLGVRLIPLETIVPGHPRHADLTAYAGEDAEMAPELLEVLERYEVRPAAVVPWAEGVRRRPA